MYIIVLQQAITALRGGPTFPFDPETFKELAAGLFEQAGGEIPGKPSL